MNNEEAYLSRKRIVLVDDEPGLRRMLETILSQAGFQTVLAFGGPREALAYCEGERGQAEPAHLFVLDVMMPGMDGFALLSNLRQIGCYAKTPAMFLTAKDEPTDRLSGLGLGADDYIPKPFLPQELILRIKAVLRRCYADENPMLDLAACRVDLSNAEVFRDDGTTAMLTAKEHEILSVLARNAGRIVTIDAICDACWGTTFGYENSLMAHIRRLREKIESDPSAPVALVTVKGLGYKLIEGGSS